MMASSTAISMAAIWRVQGERMVHFSRQLQPMSESSIGKTPSRLASGQFQAVPHRSLLTSGNGVLAKGAF